MFNTRLAACLALLLFLLLPGVAFGADHLHLDGASLSGIWVIPFVCMLLSIAIMPLTVPHFWEHNFGKIALGWGLAFLIPCGLIYGMDVAMYQAWHSMTLEYIPFIVLLFALFTVAGGVRVTGSLAGTPVVNTGILLLGTLLASWMGTTGAAILFIRPILRANNHRKYRKHTVVFFIFLVANVGGSLTPLGDPPLFLGFLKGVSFFWTTKALLPMFLVVAILLLCLYFIMDTILYMKEGKPVAPPDPDPETRGEKLGLEGKVNLLLLLGIIAAVLASGSIDVGSFTVYHVDIAYANLARDIILLGIAGVSLWVTEDESRRKNGFSWAPIAEVAKLFLGIFLSMIPAIAILQAGEQGALSGVIAMVSKDGQPVPGMYFWLTGALSSFLDNAPTYVVFFNTAGGDAAMLMTEYYTTLAAISAGAVFMGANTYIGNAPNFMVRSIAEDRGVPMPSFFGYMLWSGLILIPCFILVTFLFFK